MIDFLKIMKPYNPWWKKTTKKSILIPDFRRPVFYQIRDDINKIPQILSIIGPRRIGKSTLLFQLIQHLIDSGTSPERILYYSFDDPTLFSQSIEIEKLLEWIIQKLSGDDNSGPSYLFLDEIQRLERWELYLKKYYDLKFPVRIIISGSASSPIFKKSRESLLGRIKDYHLLPFSFREYFLHELRSEPSLEAEVINLYENHQYANLQASENLLFPCLKKSDFPSPKLQIRAEKALNTYFLEGGFPEVWQLPGLISKQDYLFDNQVKKVIYEDLVLAAEFRKPELLKRFYISLLEVPGREMNLSTISQESGISIQQIEKYFPLLEMTDLIYHIEKFRVSPLRVRRGMMKFYLVDLALRNAVLRLNESLLLQPNIVGLYAENLVFLALKKWRNTIQIDYFRDRASEIDFIVHFGVKKFLPVEVKYRSQILIRDFVACRNFVQKSEHSIQPVVVTKKWKDFGLRENTVLIPLPLFLLLFD